MKITLEHSDTTIAIETSDVSIDGIIEYAVIPALIGVGFRRETIIEAMDNVSEEVREDE